MSLLLDAVVDYFPGNGDVGVPLQSEITITLSGLNYDEDSLVDGFFLEGPDTDQFVGPGLLELAFPANVSQNDLDDLLRSPGYQGIVQGTVTVSGISGNTVVTFEANQPLAPLIEYRVNLTAVTNTDLEDIEGFITFSFTTGSGSIEELPADVSTTVLGQAVAESSSPTVTGTPPLAVVTTRPLDHSVQNSADLAEITVRFNNEIDPTTIDGYVSIVTTPATDHPLASTASIGDIGNTLSAVGNILIIAINDPGTQLFNNDVVTVTIGSGILDTAGDGLDEDYVFEFMLTTAPSYTNLRKIRIEVGGFLGNTYDDTIQTAILEASLEASVLTFSPYNMTNSGVYQHARREYTSCKASYILMDNLNRSLLKSKTLGDLHVDYDTNGIRNAMDRLLDCQDKWVDQIMSGGGARADKQPSYVVKGEYDPDRPLSSRMWESTECGDRTPAANTRERSTYQRRYKTTFRKKYW